MSKSTKQNDQQGEEISSTVAENTAASNLTNYKKYLTEFVEYANEGIHSSINSLQSIDILQKIPHDYKEDNLFAPTTEKFLGDYSSQDIYRDFDKYNIKNELEKKGYKDIVISFDTSDYFVHRLSVADKSLSTAVKIYKGQFLIDLFVRKKHFVLSDFKTYQLLRRIETFHTEKKILNDKQIEKINYVDGFDAKELYKFMENQLNDKYSLYLIEWICMQDPYSEFSQDRPQFPGQNYPGLRIGRKFGNMLIDLLATNKERDGLSNIPEHFHNAYIYHKQDYTFLNPAFQAYFDCLCDSLKNDLNVHGLSAVSWAFHNGHVKNRNGKIEIWNPEEQVYPTSPKLRLYFVSHGYKRFYNIFYNRGYQVSIDWENAKEIWKFSLNLEFNKAANHFGNEIDGDDIAEDVNVIEHEKEIDANIIEDVTNQHHQNERHIWNLEKSKI